MNDHELLIRHAVAWADKRRQPLDRDLLETVLDLRDFHDASAPQEWPAGSAEHLMLVRWPSHGPSGVPDVEALVATLDSFWRFLRGTGRMASVSADPKSLTREARRAAPEMAAACEDPSRHSASKALMEFGESIGISLEDADSVDEVNDRLQQIMDAWNAQPYEQRLARSSGPAHQGSVPGMAATELIASLMEDEGDQDPWDLADEDELVPFSDPAEVAADVRASPFVQQCRRLVEWVGDGRQITGTDVLRLAPAREAYEVLDLYAWDREDQRLLAGEDHPLPLESEELMRSVSRDSFRSAAACRPLDRLWLACLEARVLELSRSRAYGAWEEPASDEEWRNRGMVLIMSALATMPEEHVPPLMGTLLHLLRPGQGPLPLRELEEWWWQSPRNVWRGIDDLDPGKARRWSDDWLHRALHEMDDMLVWRRSGETLVPTALGHDVAIMAVALSEQGVIDA